jgi:phytoene dehydrogenase-like protein
MALATRLTARAITAALTAAGGHAAAAAPAARVRAAAAAATAAFSTSSTSTPPLDPSIADAAHGRTSSSSSSSSASTDVVIVGGGHNALVSATLLARSGLAVRLFEARPRLGGACVTTHPFTRSAPGLAHSLGAYLLGPFPPELLATLGITDLPIIRRDPHYFLPTPVGTPGGGGFVLFGSDTAATRAQFTSLFSEQDWDANERLNAEMAAIREDFAGALLLPDGSEAPGLEAVLDAHIRPSLRPAVKTLLTDSVASYLARFGFVSDLVPAMYAATDGLSGSSASPYDAGTGYNFLVHNLVRLPQTNGAWALVKGGMGTLTARLAGAARAAGVRIETGTPVASIDTVDDGGTRRVTGVTLADGRAVPARAVLAGADPFTAARLVDAGGGGSGGNEAAPSSTLPPSYTARLAALCRPGWTFKVNLALRDLPRYACCPDQNAGQHNTTAHLLAGAENPRAATGAMDALAAAAADAAAGRLPDFPPVEVYTHSAADPSVRAGGAGGRGHHSAALFVQLVPPGPFSSGDSPAAQAYARHLLTRVCDSFAPGFSDLVDEMVVLTAKDIEREFGISGGHIHHADNAAGCLDRRVPYRTPGVEGLYAGSAACHPGGSVMGVAGHNAAGAVVKDMGAQRGW